MRPRRQMARSRRHDADDPASSGSPSAAGSKSAVSHASRASPLATRLRAAADAPASLAGVTSTRRPAAAIPISSRNRADVDRRPRLAAAHRSRERQVPALQAVTARPDRPTAVPAGLRAANRTEHSSRRLPAAAAILLGRVIRLAASSPAAKPFFNGALWMLANDPVTQARIDLTTALRAAARHGLNEGVCNHFSMTVPGREDLFLVNPQGLHWSEITPSDIVMADGDGNIIEGKYRGRADRLLHPRPHPCRQPARQGRAAHPHALRDGADVDPRRPPRNVHPERLPLLGPHRLRRGCMAASRCPTTRASACAGRWATRTSCSCATTASSSRARPLPKPTTTFITSSVRRWCRCWPCRPAGSCTISTRRWPSRRPGRSRARRSRPSCILNR